jgi:glyoxylase-like metal-dependent hydrolase (beta-lactamase superfamily II)
VTADAPAAAAAAGIHTIPIPTPFAVGRVNVYLLEDEPLTLIDTGPNSGKALDELELALDERGHAIEDLGLIVITHQHMDHLGLAAIVARRSGAEVVALDLLAPFLADYSAAMEGEDELALALMLRHGIPEDVAHALRSVSQSFRAWGSSVEVTRTLRDGATLALRDRKLQVHHRPGHSPSDTVFFDADRGILIGGDHLIKHISSNPLISRPLGGASATDEPPAASAVAGHPGDHGRRSQALITYMRSLRETRAMPAQLVLAGHGDPITDHAELIDERFRLHGRRAERIFSLIAQRPRTGYEIAQELWANVAVTQAFLTLSEVLGHVDLLLEDGRVVERVDEEVVRFVAS